MDAEGLKRAFFSGRGLRRIDPALASFCASPSTRLGAASARAEPPQFVVTVTGPLEAFPGEEAGRCDSRLGDRSS